MFRNVQIYLCLFAPVIDSINYPHLSFIFLDIIISVFQTSSCFFLFIFFFFGILHRLFDSIFFFQAIVFFVKQQNEGIAQQLFWIFSYFLFHFSNTDYFYSLNNGAHHFPKGKISYTHHQHTVRFFTWLNNLFNAC